MPALFGNETSLTAMKGQMMSVDAAVIDRVRKVDNGRADRSGGRGSIWSAIRPDRLRLLFTYILFNVENLLRVFEPLALGLAVDGLLHSRYSGLVVFATVRVVCLLTGIGRQMFDTRLFAGIYARLASDVASNQRRMKSETSVAVARSSMSREIVEFFERYLPIIASTLYTIGGSLAMLGWYDLRLTGCCLLLVIPATALSIVHGRRSAQLNSSLNDELERQTDVISRGRRQEILRHYDSLADVQVALSDAIAVNFGVIGSLALVLMIGVLLVACRVPDMMPGDLLAISRYVWMFAIGLDQMPLLVERAGRLRDIARRL